jgi:hypothetical protein
MKLRRTLLLLLLVAGCAQADTMYKCTETDGAISYTNDKTRVAGKKNCAVLTQDKAVSSFQAPKIRAATPTPEGFPRVTSDTQKTRDGDRRSILANELQTEQQKLDDAKQKLAEQEAIRNGDERNYQRVLDRLKPYQDEVQLHEQNVDALQRELNGQR